MKQTAVTVLWRSGFLLLVFMFLSVLYQFSRHLRGYQTQNQPKPYVSKKIILSWNGYYHLKKFMTPDLDEIGCPVRTCHVTSKRSMLDMSDAVVFHFHDAKQNDLPAVKTTGQKWILMNLETPLYDPLKVLSMLGPWVDWTLTYRTDSDIPWLYGSYRHREVDTDGQEPDLPKIGKRLPAAWMVSHCKTFCRREDLVNQLKKYIQVDEFGMCNNKELEIPRAEAFRFLAERYIFYMSLENCFCKDYATEKVFLPLYHGLIPVVYGGANYQAILPPGSYIDFLDFTSVQELAQHMHKVISNETLYISYFHWRRKFVINKTEGENSSFFCDICARLHEDKAESFIGRDLTIWWNKTTDCSAPLHSPPLEQRDTLLKMRNDWYT